MTDDEGWTVLHCSAREGSYESIKLLLAMGSNIKQKTKNGRNCLHIAADYGHFNLCLTLIIKHNTHVYLSDNHGWTALHYFAKMGSYELVKAAAGMGIDVNLQTNNGENCLHIAADNGHLSLSRTLINKHNIDLRLPNNQGWTAFHYFAKNGSYELVKAVVDMGIDINLKTNNAQNCLHIAAENGHLNLCRKLISKHNIDVQSPDNDGWNALHYFAKNGSYELVKVVADMGNNIKQQTNEEKNCLHIAADNSHLNLCMTLINKHNFHAQLPDLGGWTALHYFAENGSYELLKAVADMGININFKTNDGKNCLHIGADKGHFNMCRKLIRKHNVDIQLCDNEGWNALHYFAKNGSYDLVKAIVDMGIDSNLKTNNGKNCLHIAAENGHLNLCRKLISKQNVDMQLPDNDGWNALHYFAKSGSYDLVKVVADMGTEIKLKTNEGKDCLHIAAENSHFAVCMTFINKHNFDAGLPDLAGWTALHYFAENGSYELVKTVADMGIDINLKTNEGKNCLHIAADNGHMNLCRKLISKYNVDVQLPDNDGWNALHYFAKKGSYELIKIVADMGTEIKLQTNDGKNCLHIAADNSHFNLCMTLINKHKFDVQLPDRSGTTALHYFVEKGSYELVKTVVDMGIDINLKNNNGENCLHIAADNGHLNLCRKLISKHNFDVQITDHEGWSPLHYFAKTSSYELLKTVADMGIDLNLKTNDGKNCLHIAADRGHFSLCRMLINIHNVDMQLPDNDGWNALHYFAKSGSYELFKIVADMGTDIKLQTNDGKDCLHIAADNSHFNLCMTLLNKHNFDARLPDLTGRTALHYSAENGSYELVKAFSDMGIDINLKKRNGKNCLHIAADNGHLNLCRKLISKHNFDVQITDHDGWTPLHYFAKRSSYELVKTVADMGIDINLKTNDGKNCLHIAADRGHFSLCRTLINIHKVDLQLPDNDGWHALHYFAKSGSYELIKIVADMGTDIKLQTNDGKDCLHIAADNSHFNLCMTLINKHNFDARLPDLTGRTALHYSAENGSYELVKAFSDMGIDINLKKRNGKNCLHIAADNGHLNLCRKLISKHNFDVQITDHEGWSPLHYFAKRSSYELVKTVADMGIDINLKTNDGKNCLHIAADRGHFSLCRTLINIHNVDMQLPDNEGWNALHYFAENGSYELVKAVADMGVDINLKTNKGKNCLHIAAEYEHLNLCRKLISIYNIDVELPDNDGWNALHYFAKKGSYELIKVVADMGTDIKMQTNEGKDCLHIAADNSHFNLCMTLINKHKFDARLPDLAGTTALHYFAENGSYELVKAVADMGTDINLKTNNGKNCLHIAADNGHLNLCRKLISKHNFDVEITDHDGWTPLHYFAKKGSYELVKTVADMGIDINLKTNDGKNCLHIAADYRHFSLFWTLINKHNVDMQIPNDNGWTTLHHFAEKGSYESVKAVVDMGIDINLKTNKGKNCLHIAADKGYLNLCRKLISKYKDDVQLPDNDGWNALHYFAEKGSYELIKTVVDMGIDINCKTNDGKNCLHIAAEKGHLGLCRKLISKYNVDVQIPEHDGWTLLHYFAERGSYELIKTVFDMGIDINLKTNDGKNCLHIAADCRYFSLFRTLINKHNVDMQTPDHNGWTTLHYFAKKGSYELVKAVADMGIDINLKTNKGKNCLHIAADNGHLNLCRKLISEHNFDVQIPEHDGWIPLHYFAKRSSYELIKTVVDMGIDINFKTNDGKNCLHIAADYGHFNLCRTLIKKHNVDMQLPDNEGWNALHYFAENGSYELVKAIADRGIDINLKTNKGKNCLHIAADNGHLNLCRKLISKYKVDVQLPDNDGWNALHYFVKKGSYELIKVVADMGADIKMQTNEGKNCLHIAADNSHFNLCMTLINKHKFDARLPDLAGKTALHYFAENGSYELVKAVANRGIDINLKTNNGKNCLHIAADNGHLNLCRKLISKHNFDVQITDREGWSPLHYFAKRSSYELVKTVADMGIDINLKTNDGKNCLHIAADRGHFSLCRTLIKIHNVDMQLPDNEGWNALHYFAENGSYEVVKSVADMGIDINLKTNNGKNCLHIAADNGHLNLCRKLISKHNFDVQVTDCEGWSPLHYFAKRSSYELVKTVADMGIDINLKTNDGKNCLHIAADRGHFSLCRTLIKIHNVDMQLPDNEGWNALHYFAENGSYELVKSVADMGIDINLKTNKGKNCLHIASENGHLDLCRKLISKHDVNVQIPEYDGWTPLHFFAEKSSYELIKTVVDMGIDINLKTDDGKNCLHIAADHGKFSLCRMLINEHKVDMQLPDNDGWNALHYFAKSGSYELIKVVADMGTDIKMQTNEGKDCLHIAAENSHFNLCMTLINKHNFDAGLPDLAGTTALHYFAENGSYELVKAVAEMGIDVNLKTSNGKNCLHVAADNGHLSLCRTLISKYIVDVQIPERDRWTPLLSFSRRSSYDLGDSISDMGLDINLTKSKAKSCLHIDAGFGHFNFFRIPISKHYGDVQLRNNGGWTPLHYFAKMGSYELVKAVAYMGIDINRKTNDGKNCLHIAADCGHFNLCRMLISKHNVDVELADNRGWTALHYFAKRGSYELVKSVADMVTDINLKTNNGGNCLHVAADFGHFNLCKMLISKHNLDVKLPNNHGWTALHYFAKMGSYELVKSAADMGIDINLKTNDGKNCLHIAADHGKFSLCRMLINEHKVDMQLPDNDGWNALHYFAKSGSYELIKVVADMGTDIKMQTNEGKDCLHIAAENSHFNLCMTLINKHNFDAGLPDLAGTTALHYFAENGSYELVKAVAEMGIDVNLKTSNGKNCLHVAADNGHLSLCRTLISKYIVDVQIPERDRWTPLLSFSRRSSYDLGDSISDMGLDINLTKSKAKSCLHIDAGFGHFNFFRIPISKHYGDVQLRNNGGWTPLHYFAKMGSYELVKAVAYMGIDINRKTNDGKNCLHIAADCGHFNLCRMLISKHNVDVELADNRGWTALHYFAKRGSYELVKSVADMVTDINLKTNNGGNCLHVAADFGHFNLCKMLISKHNLDVKLPNNHGWTALHYFAKMGSYELVKSAADMGTDINLKTNNGENCLHVGADYGHFNLCRKLINEHNFDVQLPENNGWTVLHYFAKNGSYELVKALADMGIDINLTTNNRENCLHIAAAYGHFSLCRTLINKHNVDVHLPENYGWTALHYFAKKGSYEFVRTVVDMGININLKTNEGKNCLHIAADCGHFSLCRTLINNHKIDVQLPDNDGWTAFHYFAQNGSYDLVKVVANMEIDINLETHFRENCLHIAAEYGRFSLCRMLISKHKVDVQLPDQCGWTALHYFASNGSYELVKTVADMGIDINLKTIDGKNCLHIAADNGHFHLCRMLISKHNADVQLPDNNGWTALHYFAKKGNYELVKSVADMGTDINLKTNNDGNCLHIAANYCHLNLCRTLIKEHKFDVQLPEDQGWTALHYFAKFDCYELLKAVADMGIDINPKTNNGENCLHIAADYVHLDLCRTLINNHKVDVQVPDNYGWAALHYFARNGSYELVKDVADMGIDINLKTNNGENCLHIAAGYGHFNLCRMLISKHNVDMLLPDNHGWTALHYFAKNGSCELVKAVADMGIDINFKTNNGENCLHIATRFGHLNLCKVFIEKYKFDVRTTTIDERTPLHFSVINGNFALFLYILRKGSEIFCKTSKMENVLHLASFGGHFNICKFILEYFIKEYEDNNIKNQYTLNGKSYSSQVFYKYKAIFLHAMDVDGNTYLNLAAKGNEAKVCELLLRYDTEIITLSNKEDKTAKDIAKDKGHKNVLNVLKAEYERSGTFFKIEFK